jgi:XTP/dITP diphosphohydrolase
MVPFEIIEDGHTFQENAIIKAKAVYEQLPAGEYVVMSDDSGITVPLLDNEPGIYSARYAGINASDMENLNALVTKLKSKHLQTAPAFYTACIAMISKYGVMTTHGWMHGRLIDEIRGSNGFGYDPAFIPKGYEITLGEMDESIKNRFSHRSKALELAKLLLRSSPFP